MKKFIQKEKIFSFIYEEALRDAVLQLSYRGNKAWIKEVQGARNSVKEYIDRILSGKYKNDANGNKHDREFCNIAKEVCDAINNVGKDKNSDHPDEFTFGNAQKLMNMVVKRFYSFCYLLPELRPNFKYCHCPMDSIMLKVVWMEAEKLYESKKRRTEKLNVGLDVQNGENFLKSWGQEHWVRENELPVRYLHFQETVRELAWKVKNEKGEKLYPIEYDYHAWKNDGQE